MKAWDMFNVIRSERKLLDPKKQVFLLSIEEQVKRGKGVWPALTNAQHQFLQACYDQVVSRKYGVEPMATDREWAAKRAIGKSRRETKGG